MTDDTARMPAIRHKWGFGMAPPLPQTQQARVHACALLFDVLDAKRPPPEADERLLTAASDVKGLFNRIVRQDQWDWFTVARQLGYPSWRISEAIAQQIAALRQALKVGDAASAGAAHNTLRRLPARRCLSVLLGRAAIIDEAGAGWVYILSTREFDGFLKIGMTTRTVEQRAQEINAATGVAVPFGVRRCWRVSDPAKAEKLVHAELAEFRLRSDREFFQVAFSEAARRVDAVIRDSGLEIRTLNALTSLEGPT